MAAKGERSRREIVNAAIELIAARGCGSCTTTAVQNELSISRGKLLHAFPTRADLLLAVATEVASVVDQMIVQAAEQAEGLRAATTWWWRATESPQVRSAFELWQALRHDPDLRQGATALVESFSIVRLAALAERSSDGRLARRDTEVTLHIIRSLLVGQRQPRGPTLPAPLQHWLDSTSIETTHPD